MIISNAFKPDTGYDHRLNFLYLPASQEFGKDAETNQGKRRRHQSRLHVTDGDIIFGISKGDRHAFQLCYATFQARVYNTALSLLQNRDEAEETTQDVFLEVYQSARRFKGESAVSTWIYRITVNKSLDHLRYRKRKKRFGFLQSIFQGNEGGPAFEVPDFHHPGIALENKEKAAILFKTIKTLSERQQTAFVLSQMEELSQREIAQVMQLSEKAVESLLQRAKLNLRKELEKFYPERRKS